MATEGPPLDRRYSRREGQRLNAALEEARRTREVNARILERSHRLATIAGFVDSKQSEQSEHKQP